MNAVDVPILDYGDIINSLFGGGPPPVAGTVSFKISWSGIKERVNVRNTDPVFGGFAGKYIRNSAQIEWTAEVGDYSFTSGPMSSSTSTFAQIGHELNGQYFSRGNRTR